MRAEPSLTVAVVARRLGVAPATLRTWDRRYGVGPSEHSAGSHRRYTPDDVARLERMRQLTLEGVTPAEAARVALADAAPELLHSESESREQLGPLEPTEPTQPKASPATGGGRIIATPGAAPEVKGLARAATALDSGTATAIVSEYVQRNGVVSTWDTLLVPVLQSIGERWESLDAGVAVEHLLSEVVLGCLRQSAASAPSPTKARTVLLACAPEEQHTLPIHVLSAALAERRVDSRVLGARVPAAALHAAVRRSGPAAVFIWAHRAEAKPTDLFEHIPVMRPPVSVVVGGPGWSGEVPAPAVYVDSLPQAVSVLTRTALGSGSSTR